MEENTKPAKERKTNVKKENKSKKDTKKKTNQNSVFSKHRNSCCGAFYVPKTSHSL